jgi:hypothetical protein
MAEITDNGKNVPDIEIYDTPGKFYAGDTAEEEYAIDLAKHEVGCWIEG